MYVYVCMYVCMYVWMDVCMDVCYNVYMYVCTYMYVCAYVSLTIVYVYVCTYIYVFIYISSKSHICLLYIRTSTVILVDNKGEVTFTEKTMIDPIDSNDPKWNTKSFSFNI